MVWSKQERVLLNYLLQLSTGNNSALAMMESGFLNVEQVFPTALKLLNALLNTPYEKIIITDRDGTILFLNDAYAKIIAVDPEEVVGRDVFSVLGKDTRMHIVGETLQPELHGLFRTANTDAVARRVPLISKGNVLGVMGKDLFDNFNDLFQVAQDAKELRSRFFVQIPKELPTNRARYGLENIVTNDPVMFKLKELVKKAALTTSTVIVQGETGVGKELFAQAIHQESKRCGGPFISVNCGAIPESLVESELFGYEGGAFTGANKKGKPGKFELANGGTILLDEISETPLSTQVKILRVLQEKEVERVGGTKPVRLDVRVVASTNKDLWQLCQQGLFREDLFYRLSVVTLEVPPLRERPQDLLYLAQYFVQKYNSEFNLEVKGLSKKAVKQLKGYYWPGNVRELAAVIEAAMNRICKKDEVLGELHLPQVVGRNSSLRYTLQESMNRHECAAILSALNEHDWHMEQTAKSLDISVASLYRKIKKHNIKAINLKNLAK